MVIRFTDLGWIRDEAEDDAPPPARQSPFSPGQSSPDSSLIRSNHVAIPSTDDPPLANVYYLYVTSPISFPTAPSKAWVHTLGHFRRSQCNQTGIGLHARRGFDRNSPRQRNYIRLVRVLVRVPNSFTGQLSLILRQRVILDALRTSKVVWIIETSSIRSKFLNLSSSLIVWENSGYRFLNSSLIWFLKIGI